MSYKSWREKMKKNAEVIFDGEEPMGRTTDMVLPPSRWLQRKKRAAQVLVDGQRLTNA